MPARLEVVAGRAIGMSLVVDRELVIGRQAKGAGRLADDDEISRTHARITLDASGYCAIEDLGSTNGTFVNGLRISGPQTLSQGDTIEVGGTTMVVRELPTPAADQLAGNEVPQPTLVPRAETPLPAAESTPSAPDERWPAPSPLVPPTLEGVQQAPELDKAATPPAPETIAPDADSAIAPTAVLSLRLEVDFVARGAKIVVEDGSEAIHLVFEDGAWRPASGSG